jgi:hypothetical protein
MEEEDAKLEATLKKIGLGSDKIKQFLMKWGGQLSEPQGY